MVSCISFNLSLYTISSKSGTISVIILFIFSNINTGFFLMRGPYYFCIFQFLSNHCSYNFSHYIFIKEVKNHHYISSHYNCHQIFYLCFSADRLTTPKLFSSFSIDTIFFPNLYVHVGHFTLTHFKYKAFFFPYM